jgi:uncharacterized protein (TIGR02246 family)
MFLRVLESDGLPLVLNILPLCSRREVVHHTLRQSLAAVSFSGPAGYGERVMTARENRRGVLPMAAVILALLASGVGAAARQDAGRDVEAVIERWATAFATLDGSRSAAEYADDARLWGTVAQEPNVGRDAIRAYFDSGRQRAKARHVVIGDHATRVYGTTAVSSGRYDFHSVLHDGTSTVRRARFSMTFVQRGGRWQIVDHHSSEVPAAP